MTGVLARLAVVVALAGGANVVQLQVPLIRQAPERCGPAALAMVLGYLGADSSAVREADRAYDPALRGALVTDLAACARRAGFGARVASPGEDSLPALLAAGAPPILLLGRGWAPLVRGHYVVVTGWDPGTGRYTVHDGGATPRRIGAQTLRRAWGNRGGQALLVWRPRP